ncbi:3-hydroxyacyl-CoA dehydrogenase [Lacisediminihabitans changchengi]|uniref:3-hydroxyacyl-CoA dehydrogenase n=1 Tax=Lacisediminihabitans changchengi TaxID=2787634 RepID=A0A934SJR0_9MICO|nr:3-hydroxyacyl-CoA dehydrogenase [Lacisediminihabitans changchengi]MBK4346976.1 3-hydroxyacyl-CoA dehydrogenase [Lacisediminihabitans changchengi]MBK4347901.1 3-hydroxyacyl-CoA dehydrogenase [Lacisediminihabitans changchengi]
MTRLTTVTVLGTGVLGSQIAYQAAYSGFTVTAYDISDAVLEKARGRFDELASVYERTVAGGANGRATRALDNVTYSSDLGDAVKDADIVIEAIPEILDLKKATYSALSGLAPLRTIFATNSSTLLPSDLMESTGRPDRFLALHFANEVWVHNTAEIMGTAKTDPAVYATVVEFARDIGMVPIELKKEKAGYVLNSLLVPFLDAAAELLIDGIADPETIDKTWRIATGAPAGPFQIYDVVGLTTAYNISLAGGPKQREFADYLKTTYLDHGKLGVATGEGFYRYPVSASVG